LIQTDEKNDLLGAKFLKRFQLQAKLQELMEQAGMKWGTHRFVNTTLLAAVAGWAAAGCCCLPSSTRLPIWPGWRSGFAGSVCDTQALGAAAAV
jgi:hypothetical protein